MNAPRHLCKESRKWWRTVFEDYHLEAHHLRLLTAAAESWDRLQEARRRIADDGAYVEDRFGQVKAHPAVGVERDCRVAFARLVRELGLDPTTPDSRPPRTGG